MSDQRPRPTFLAVVLALATSALAAWWGMSLSDFTWGDPLTADDTWWYAGSLGGVLIGYVLLHVPAHELGHLAAAVLLRLPLLGMRIGPVRLGVQLDLPGTHGHVAVRPLDVRHLVPVRMALMALAGPAANLAVSWFAYGVATDPSAPVPLRALAVGTAVGGVYVAVANVLPRTIGAITSDGGTALRWLLRPAAQREQIRLAVDVARLAGTEPAAPVADDALAGLRSEARDPRPLVAQVALAALLQADVPEEERRRDVELVTEFVGRSDVDGHVRALIGSSYALWVGIDHLVHLPDGQGTVPESPEVRCIVRLAETAWTADRESLEARISLGLARLIEDRYDAARSLLVNAPSATTAELRARALAVRGMAECELGALDDARRLADNARDLAPDELLVKMLDLLLASKALA